MVRATNPKGKTIEVAILCDDIERASEEIILLIFSRWVQENDFKYLNKHFRIDQITSYQAISYSELAEELADKQMLSTAHRSLTKHRREETSRLKNLLWKVERAQRRESKRQADTDSLEQQLEKTNEKTEKTALTKQLGNQRGQKNRAEGNVEKWKQAIEKHHEKIEQISQQLAEASAEQSRIEHQIEREAVKIKGSKKRLMDVLKVLARNHFYIMLAPFKEDYDNYRDDHVIFRSLTTSCRIIEADENQVKCQLVLEPDYPPQIRRHLEKYLAEWNAQGPEIPDGSGRALTLKLITAAGIRIAPSNPADSRNH
ncbi:MAG: myosin heavy subunit [Verrucomicrobiales bacterium]